MPRPIPGHPLSSQPTGIARESRGHRINPFEETARAGREIDYMSLLDQQLRTRDDQWDPKMRPMPMPGPGPSDEPRAMPMQHPMPMPGPRFPRPDYEGWNNWNNRNNTNAMEQLEMLGRQGPGIPAYSRSSFDDIFRYLHSTPREGYISPDRYGRWRPELNPYEGATIGGAWDEGGGGGGGDQAAIDPSDWRVLQQIIRAGGNPDDYLTASTDTGIGSLGVPDEYQQMIGDFYA